MIENRPGGSANIGMVQVAKSPPDGYTILLVSSSFVINPALFANPGYDPYKDFAPLAMPVSSPNILVAHPSLPAKTMKEFLALVKANPGKYDYASPGNGSGPHLSAELLILQGGGDIKHIPYNGGAPAIQAVLGNQVALAFSALPPALPHINGQKLIPLAISSKSRFAALPAVPTIAESGFPVFEGDTQQFIMVPAGTPKMIIDLLNQEIIKIVNAPDTKDKLSSLGYSLSSHTPEQTGALIKTEIAKWTRVVKAGNIKPD
jgi:tripartite-type tricarboxylate transporter receptor subunit TctC